MSRIVEILTSESKELLDLLNKLGIECSNPGFNEIWSYDTICLKEEDLGFFMVSLPGDFTVTKYLSSGENDLIYIIYKVR